MDDFRFIKDSGVPVGFWLRDPGSLDKPGSVEAILMMYGGVNLIDPYVKKDYRKVANTLNADGGCFVMFGGRKAPGES